MGSVTIILVYVVIWWLVFFAALPVGVKHQSDPDENTVEGTDPGAPSNPNLKKKAIYTSVIALALTIAYYFVANSDLISFRA